MKDIPRQRGLSISMTIGAAMLLFLAMAPPSAAAGRRSIWGSSRDGKAAGMEDIMIRTHTGNMKLANPSGGITVESVSGDCDVSSGGGALVIGTVTGSLKALTKAGEIRIGSVTGGILASTRAGNISISRAQQHAEVSTDLGEIVIEHGESVTARTIQGGDVKLLDAGGETDIVAKGNITMVVNRKLPEGAGCRLQTDVGNIILYLPDDFAADFEISTPYTMDPDRETRIESDFTYKNFKQKVDKSGDSFTISTTINGGGSRFRLYVNKGNVFINKIKKSVN